MASPPNQEQKLSTLLNLSEDAFFEFDLKGRYLNIWVRDEALLAQPKKELLKKSIFDVLDEDKAKQFLDFFKEVIEKNKPLDLEYSIETPSETLWFLGRGEPLNSNGTSTVLFCARDITEKKHSDIARDMLLQSVGLGVWSIDNERGQVTWDQGMHKIYGTIPGEFQLNLDSWMEKVHPADRTLFSDAMSSAINESASYDIIFRTLSDGSEIRYISAKGKLSCDKKGNPIQITGINLDITEKMKVTEKLRHTNKLKSIGELSAGIGHEINNPLLIASGTLALINSRLNEIDLLPPNIKEQMLACSDALERISTIVQGLRTFARVDAEETEVFDLIAAIHSNVRLVKTIYEKEGIHIRLNLPEKAVYARGLSGRFQQAILNLFSNARDAMKNSKQRFIHVEVEAEGPNLMISVSDNGSGIEESVQEKIFDSFFTTKEVGEGMGLGLSLTHSIISEMGGSIQVDSKPGMGTKFCVILPVLDNVVPLTEVSNNPLAVVEPVLQGRVLVLDDEPGIRMILKEVLTRKAFHVQEAESGAEALKILEGSDYDVVITDMIMPGMNGDKFANMVSDLKLENPPLIIGITGGVDGGVKTKGSTMTSHIDRIVFKPFRPIEIVTAINELLADQNVPKVA